MKPRNLFLLIAAAILALPVMGIAQDDPGMGMQPAPPPPPPPMQPGEPGQPGTDRPERPGPDRGPFFRQPPERGPQVGPDGRVDRRAQAVEQMIERALQALGLEGEGAEKFRSVLREAEAERMKAQQELEQKLNEIRRAQEERLAETLTPEQLENFRNMMRSMERNMRRGQFGPGGQGGPGGPGRPEQPQGPDLGAMMAEAGLTAEQQQQVQRILRGADEARRELMNAARNGDAPPEAVQEQMAKVQEAIDAQLSEVLSTEQFKKLSAALRDAVANGGLDGRGPGRGQGQRGPGQRPDPRAALRELGVSDEVMQQLEALTTETRDKVREAIRGALQDGTPPENIREQIREMQAAAEAKARELLTDEQYEAWQQMARNMTRGQGRRFGQGQGQGQPGQPGQGRPGRPGMPGQPGGDGGNGGDGKGTDGGNGDDF